jgi:hypothetical protein
MAATGQDLMAADTPRHGDLTLVQVSASRRLENGATT